ncbi:MAG: hypothetical protein ACYC4K_06150 [Thiobacillus sp.]
MHEGSPYGYLKVNNKVILPANLSRMVGATLQEIEGWLSELFDAGVYSIDDECIFSRRMVRDEEIRLKRSAGGHLGGNPALINQENKVEGRLTSEVKQNPTPASASSSASISDTNVSLVGKESADACPHQKIIDLYHLHLPASTQIKIWNGDRASHLRARWREDKARQSLDWWEKFFVFIAESRFLTGRATPNAGREAFTANLAWIVMPNNFAKIIEGEYHKDRAA